MRDGKGDFKSSRDFYILLRECFEKWGNDFLKMAPKYKEYADKLGKRETDESFWDFPKESVTKFNRIKE